jgi:hypothetical protein
MNLPSTNEVTDRASGAVHWITNHTGVPAIVVAAVLIVVSWKLLKTGLHLAIEVACVLALLVVATHFGWIAF